MKSWSKLCVIGLIALNKRSGCLAEQKMPSSSTDKMCSNTLIYNKKSSGYQIHSEVVYQGSLYQATEWVSDAPNSNSSKWKLLGACAKNYENGKFVNCSGTPVYKTGSESTKDDILVNVKGGLFKFQCPSYGVFGNPVESGCDVQGYCGKDCSGVPMFTMDNSSPSGDVQYPAPDGLIHHVWCKYPTYFTNFFDSNQCEDKGICGATDRTASDDRTVSSSVGAAVKSAAVNSNGSAAGSVDCSGVEVLSVNGKSIKGDIIVTNNGKDHLFHCNDLTWVSSTSSGTCVDRGECKSGTVVRHNDSNDRTSDNNKSNEETGPANCKGVPSITESGLTTKGVMEKDGKLILVTCKTPQTVTKWYTPTDCTERECDRTSIDSDKSQMVDCKNVQTYDGDSSVKAGFWRKHDASGRLIKYQCKYEGMLDGCDRLGVCDPSIKDDKSQLTPADCSSLKPLDRFKWYQAKERTIVGGYAYESLEAVQVTDGNVETNPKWVVIGPCKEGTAHGVEVDCSTFKNYNKNDKYCPAEHQDLNVKYQGMAFRVKECMQGAGVIPGSQEAYETLGYCKTGTDKVEPEVDCSDYMEYVPQTEYVKSPVELLLKNGKTITPLMKPMRLHHDGYAFESRGDLGWSDKEPTIGSEEYNYIGKCKKGTAETLQINCSKPNRAFKLLPEMVLDGVTSTDDVVLVYDTAHNVYQQVYYYQHPFDDIVQPKKLLKLGQCITGTEISGPRPLDGEVDCSDLPVWNPKNEYFNNKEKSFKAQKDGNVYAMKGEWAGWKNPELNSEWIGVGHCKEGTGSNKVTPGPYDYSIDQTMAIMKCCADSAFCGYYMGGQFHCFGNREELHKKMALNHCPWVDMSTAENFLAENYHGSLMEKSGISTCDDVKNSLMMEFYPRKIVKSAGAHAWNRTHVAPYFDVGLATFPPLDKIVKDERDGYIKYFHAAFITQSVRKGTKCVGDFGSVIPYQVGPRMWGEEIPGAAPGAATYNYDKLNALREKGGDWGVSFGGYNGIELADSKQCEGATLGETVANIKKAYSDVINYLGASHANWDIEAGAIQALTHKDTNFVYRALAINEMVNENDDLVISWTLPVAPTGLTDDGMAFLETIMSLGTRISYVMGMTMDYGELVCPSKPDDPSAKTMHQCEMEALDALAKQVYDTAVKYNRAHPSWTSYKDVYPIIGSIPMIGQNDVPDEIYFYEDAKNSVEEYKKLKLGVSSFWAITRDKAKGDDKYFPPKTFTDVLEEANYKPSRFEKTYADSISDGVSKPGDAFVFSNIFSKYSKAVEADNAANQGAFVGIPESKAKRMTAAQYETKAASVSH